MRQKKNKGIKANKTLRFNLIMDIYFLACFFIVSPVIIQSEK